MGRQVQTPFRATHVLTIDLLHLEKCLHSNNTINQKIPERAAAHTKKVSQSWWSRRTPFYSRHFIGWN